MSFKEWLLIIGCGMILVSQIMLIVWLDQLYRWRKNKDAEIVALIKSK